MSGNRGGSRLLCTLSDPLVCATQERWRDADVLVKDRSLETLAQPRAMRDAYDPWSTLHTPPKELRPGHDEIKPPQSPSRTGSILRAACRREAWASCHRQDENIASDGTLAGLTHYSVVRFLSGACEVALTGRSARTATVPTTYCAPSRPENRHFPGVPPVRPLRWISPCSVTRPGGS